MDRNVLAVHFRSMEKKSPRFLKIYNMKWTLFWKGKLIITGAMEVALGIQLPGRIVKYGGERLGLKSAPPRLEPCFGHFIDLESLARYLPSRS